MRGAPLPASAAERFTAASASPSKITIWKIGARPGWHHVADFCCSTRAGRNFSGRSGTLHAANACKSWFRLKSCRRWMTSIQATDAKPGGGGPRAFPVRSASTGIYVPIASLPTLGCCLPSRTTRRGRSIERSVTSNAVLDHHFRNPDLDP